MIVLNNKIKQGFSLLLWIFSTSLYAAVADEYVSLHSLEEVNFQQKFAPGNLKVKDGEAILGLAGHKNFSPRKFKVFIPAGTTNVAMSNFLSSGNSNFQMAYRLGTPPVAKEITEDNRSNPDRNYVRLRNDICVANTPSGYISCLNGGDELHVLSKDSNIIAMTFGKTPSPQPVGQWLYIHILNNSAPGISGTNPSEAGNLNSLSIMMEVDYSLYSAAYNSMAFVNGEPTDSNTNTPITPQPEDPPVTPVPQPEEPEEPEEPSIPVVEDIKANVSGTTVSLTGGLPPYSVSVSSNILSENPRTISVNMNAGGSSFSFSGDPGAAGIVTISDASIPVKVHSLYVSMPNKKLTVELNDVESIAIVTTALPQGAATLRVFSGTILVSGGTGSYAVSSNNSNVNVSVRTDGIITYSSLVVGDALITVYDSANNSIVVPITIENDTATPTFDVKISNSNAFTPTVFKPSDSLKISGAIQVDPLHIGKQGVLGIFIDGPEEFLAWIILNDDGSIWNGINPVPQYPLNANESIDLSYGLSDFAQALGLPELAAGEYSVFVGYYVKVATKGKIYTDGDLVGITVSP